MKSTYAQWIIGHYDRLRNDVELTKKSFREAELLRQSKKLNPLILLRTKTSVNRVIYTFFIRNIKKFICPK